MSAPLVSVIIVSYGTRDLTLAALDSVKLLEQETPLEAIVVDNASPDDSADAIAARAPWATLVRSPKNRGFASGANLGARLARGTWLLFLNSDARLVPGTLPRMLEAAGRLDRPGAMGPRLIGPQGTESSVGRFYGPWRDTVRAFRLYRIFPGWNLFEDVHVRRLPSVTTEVEWITGACLLIRRDVFEGMQGFDEAYFMYVEDMDLCYRLRHDGRINLYVPEAIAYHERGQSPRSDRRVVIEGGQAPEYFVRKTGMRYPRTLQRTLRWWLLVSYLATLSVRLLMQQWRGQDTAPTRQLVQECRRSLRALVERPTQEAEPEGSVRLES